ncbi:MAG TPA: ATP-binding protein, partial [Candidatus Binatia bacterium]|nr:ATP-binding protein [Candidatus Binatia bacterium]
REIEILAGQPKSRDYGIRVNALPSEDDYFTPVLAQLDIRTAEIKPRPQEPQKTDLRADRIALEAGKRATPLLLDAQRTTLSGIRILDHQGVVVGGRADIGLSFAHLEEFQRAKTGQYASLIRERPIHRPTRAFASISRGTGIRVFVAFPILADSSRLLGVVLLSRTPQSILEHLYNQKEKVFVLASIVLVLAAALVVFTSYAVARPLHGLIEQTKRFAKGEKEAMEPLKSPITDEVALLSQSFAEMARTLEARAEYIRNFAAQVSHEFKTPLTGIRGAVELLQEHEDGMSPEQRARFLRNVAQDTDRLQRLTDRLLEMARADVIDPTPGTTELKVVLDDLAERYRQQNLQVSVSGADEMRAAIAAEICETVLTNLLDNSRQHGADRVDIALSRAGGEIHLLIADNGSGISSANAEHIFESFFTTRRDQGGTGLGLAIVQSLLRAYKGKISLEPSTTGATFRVTVPEAPG